MHMNHQAVYASQPTHPHLNKPLPGTASANPYDTANNPQGFGTTTNVYSNYSSGGGPPVFCMDGLVLVAGGRGVVVEVPPPAYEPKRNYANAAVVSAINS